MATADATFDPLPLIRPEIRDLPSYVPSRPDAQPDRIIRLDMNESPYGPSPKALAAVQSFTDTHRYPDFGQSELRAALSRYTGVPAEQIICGAGLDDVLTSMANLVLQAGDEVVISEPTFGVYRILAALHGGKTVDVPLVEGFQLDPDAVLAAIGPRTKVVIICTPNNPTGNNLDPAAIEQICAGAPCFVVIDEAYAEFAGTSYISFLDRFPNVIVARTMSKFAGLAGMRVGYGMFPKSLVPHLRHVTPPFHNVGMASVAAAVASLDDLEHLQEVVDRIVGDREQLAANLREMPGVEPLPSQTNFLLVRLPVENAGPIVEELGRRGVLVRHFGRPELGILDCLRVTVGTPEEHDIFLSELESVLAEKGSAA
jgi:histidinol-phosphate aminotransferase